MRKRSEKPIGCFLPLLNSRQVAEINPALASVCFVIPTHTTLVMMICWTRQVCCTAIFCWKTFWQNTCIMMMILNQLLAVSTKRACGIEFFGSSAIIQLSKVMKVKH